MPAWTVTFCRVTEATAETDEDRREAYRAWHAVQNVVIEVAFARRSDAERACEIVNAEIGDGPREELRSRVYAKFGDFPGLRRYLIENCCQW